MTYRAQGIDDPTATSRFDWLPTGFHAIILSPSGTVLIDPYAQGATQPTTSLIGKGTRRIWLSRSSVASKDSGIALRCPIGTGSRRRSLPAQPCGLSPRPGVHRGICHGGGQQYRGGRALAAEVLIMNRVNGVYERDVAIHMNIIANNNLITYASDNMSCGGSCTTAERSLYQR